MESGAREAALAGWDLACQIGISDEWADMLALLAAPEGRPRRAARQIGYAEANYAASGSARRASDAHAAARALDLVRARLDSGELARLWGRGISSD
jgi:hypothetical protein